MKGSQGHAAGTMSPLIPQMGYDRRSKQWEGQSYQERLSHRFKLSMQATLQQDGEGDIPVLLRDSSAHGFMGEAGKTILIGSYLGLALATGSL